MAFTLQSGQVVIAAGGAVQLANISQALLNGVIITANTNNNATGGTVGSKGVTTATNGTGNGSILYPGASLSLGAGAVLSNIYVNGTTGDVFTYLGN